MNGASASITVSALILSIAPGDTISQIRFLEFFFVNRGRILQDGVDCLVYVQITLQLRNVAVPHGNFHAFVLIFRGYQIELQGSFVEDAVKLQYGSGKFPVIFNPRGGKHLVVSLSVFKTYHSLIRIRTAVEHQDAGLGWLGGHKQIQRENRAAAALVALGPLVWPPVYSFRPHGVGQESLLRREL